MARTNLPWICVMTRVKNGDALAVQASREQTSVSRAVSDKDREETSVPASKELEATADRASRPVGALRCDVGQSSRVVQDVSKVDFTGKFKSLAGSDSSAFNESLVHQTFKSLPWAKVEVEDRARLAEAMTGAMKGIAPRDEIEGMLSALLVALHFAVLESLRCAHIDDQLPTVRWAALNQANKGARTVVTVAEALNRYRGKVQQKVRVEHVHVNHGGQAIVGSIETGNGSKTKSPRKRGAGKPIAD